MESLYILKKTMPNNGLAHYSQNVFSKQSHSAIKQQPLRGIRRAIRQDKGALFSARIASRQPAPIKKGTRAHQTDSTVVRSQNQSTTNQKSVKVTVWVKPGVKAELHRVAEQDGLSVSATGAAFLEEAIRQKSHIQHAVLLQPIIEQAITKQMRSMSTRLAWLLVRVAFDAGQTRSLVTNILGRQPGVTPDVLKTILANSGKTAKGNITRRTPQITELIEAVEQWMIAEDRE